MTRIISMTLIAALSACTASAAPKTEDEKTFYALGASVAKRLHNFGLKSNEVTHVLAGFEDARRKKKLKVDVKVYGAKAGAIATRRIKKRSQKEKDKGQAFADKAAKKKGARKEKSGLVFQDIKKGTGKSPTATDRVKVHYHGTFIDGQVFDSSVERNKPTEFPLNGVIPCWTEGVQMIKTGGKARLICPSSIAYGDRGRGDIPGGATLVFEVELPEIVN